MDRHGWRQDPYGIHEHRYYSVGHPTSLVRDGVRESFDEPPDRTSMSEVRRPEAASSPGAGANAPSPGKAAPGWYGDPSGSRTQWYWSGSAWTKCLQDVTAGPPAGPAAPDITAVGLRPRIGRRTKVGVAGAAMVMALAALIGATTSATVEIKSVAPSSASQPPIAPTAPAGDDGLSSWVRAHIGLLTALGNDATIEGAAMNTWSSSNYADESSLLVAAEQMNADIEAAQSLPTIPDSTAEQDWSQWYTSLGTGQAAVLRAISDSFTGGVVSAQGLLQVASSSFDTATLYLMGLNTRLHALGVGLQIPPDPTSAAPPRAGTGTRPASAD